MRSAFTTTTDADGNEMANALYRKSGFQHTRRFLQRKGRWMNEYVIDRGDQARVAARVHDSNARQPVSTSLEEAVRCNVCRHRDAASHASLCRARTIDYLGRWPAYSVQPNARGSKRPAIPHLEIPNHAPR